MKGTAHVFKRDHINTDEIIPACYLNTDSEQELATHAMEGISAGFVKKVRPGDLVVAGADFGCGSSREHAVWALRGSGVTAVIAHSFARIFYRNAVNNGFLLVECPAAAQDIKDGETVEIDVQKGSVRNVTQDKAYTFNPLPEFAIQIMDAGGLLPWIKSKAGRRR